MTRRACRFCGQPSTLLCDGRIYDNGAIRARVPMGGGFNAQHVTSCDAPMCRRCAQNVSRVHVYRSRKAGGCYWDTIDLCPDCQKAQEKPIQMEAGTK